jgi:glycosyltransferase involved in cell wall biosynthesis
MKILISAIACNPLGSSEAMLGWLACKALANMGELWILVSEDHRAGVEESRARGVIPDHMHFEFTGVHRKYSENRMLARLQSWKNYIEFNHKLLPVAQALHARIGFDIAHHVTYSTWRVGSPLWRLGIQFIWGPISGTEVFPLAQFGRILSPTAKAFEAARIVSGVYSKLAPETKRCAKNAFHVFAAHNEAVEHLARLRGRTEGISVISYFTFSPADVAAFARTEYKQRGNEPLKIIAGGNLEGRKGVAIAIEGLALAKKQGANFRYRITSTGPERAHLEALAKKLGLENEVSIGKAFSREDYMSELKDSDLFLLPSLREGGGLTMMEAMLAGCVPIVARCGGPGTAVTKECGVPIPVITPRQMAKDIASAVVRFDKNRALIPKMGASAAARIAGYYAHSRFLTVMKDVYDNALSARPAR